MQLAGHVYGLAIIIPMHTRYTFTFTYTQIRNCKLNSHVPLYTRSGRACTVTALPNPKSVNLRNAMAGAVLLLRNINQAAIIPQPYYFTI